MPEDQLYFPFKLHSVNVKHIIVGRKKSFRLQFNGSHHFYVFFILQIDFDNRSGLATDTTGLTVARGTPVCRGKYRGVAKVITRLADAATIKQVFEHFTNTLFALL